MNIQKVTYGLDIQTRADLIAIKNRKGLKSEADSVQDASSLLRELLRQYDQGYQTLILRNEKDGTEVIVSNWEP